MRWVKGDWRTSGWGEGGRWGNRGRDGDGEEDGHRDLDCVKEERWEVKRALTVDVKRNAVPVQLTISARLNTCPNVGRAVVTLLISYRCKFNSTRSGPHVHYSKTLLLSQSIRGSSPTRYGNYARSPRMEG